MVFYDSPPGCTSDQGVDHIVRLPCLRRKKTNADVFLTDMKDNDAIAENPVFGGRRLLLCVPGGQKAANGDLLR